MSRPFAQREEVSSQGFDPFRQLAPDAFGAPASTGILLPSLAVTYLVLLAVADLAIGDTLVGIKQYLDLLSVQATGEESPVAPYYPWRQPVVDPLWRGFSDAGDTWVLTREPKHQPHRLQGPVDQESFVFRDSDSAALVYETAAFPPAAVLPGYLGLNAYRAPAVQGVKVQAIRDRRWPWTKQSNARMRFTCDAPERWRLYAEITQTNPETRNLPTISSLIDNYALPPEDGFLQNFRNARYGWVAGALIIERGGC